MKKIFVGLFAFTLGITAVYFLKNKKVEPVNNIESAKIALFRKPISDLRETIKNSKNEDENRTEGFKPFFDSFAKSEYVNDEYQGFSGWFIPDEFKEMKEVWTLLLSRDSENSKNGKMIWKAMLLTSHKNGSPKDNGNFFSTYIMAEKNRLKFRTNKIEGVEYKFHGKFFKDGKDFGEEEKVLKGTLQKFVKGKKVAEFTSDFKFYEPKCWH
jgi:hypothetical protein